MHTAASEKDGTPIVPPERMTHQHLICTADSLQVAVTLIAPAEGHARFVARSMAVTTEPLRGIPGAFTRLGAQCGYPVSEAMASAAVVSGPPLRIRVIGEPAAVDSAALEALVQFGIAEIIALPGLPPRRAERDASWSAPALEALHEGRIEALLVLVPPGTLPRWAAQILAAISERTAIEPSRCVIVASDADLAEAVPTGCVLVVRDDHLAPRLARLLNRLRAYCLIPNLPTGTPAISRPEALIAAARAMGVECETPCVFVDVSDGTTIVVADARAVVVHHDPEVDFSRGAPALLLRYGWERVARWVPFPIEERALRAWALRRISCPVASLEAQEDTLIASAFARAGVSHMIETARIGLPTNAHWAIGPALARLVSPSAAVRFVADLLPPSGVAIVTRDTDDLFAAVGALSISHPLDAADLLARDGRIPAGSVVRPTVASGRRDAPERATLVAGERTWQTPVAADALTTIACDDAALLTMTGSNPRVNRLAIQGGAAGIVIDTRRRPIDAASSAAERPSVSGRLRPPLAVEESPHD